MTNLRGTTSLIRPDGSPIAPLPAPRRKRVVANVPSPSEMKAGMAMSFTTMVSYTVTRGIDVVAQNYISSVITVSRNKLTEDALKFSPDYVFWIDADMQVPANTIERLISHGKDIVGATYNRRTPPFSTLGHCIDTPPEDWKSVGLLEFDYMPGGVMLIKADVYRKLKWPWYWETYHREHLGVDRIDALIQMLTDSHFVEPPESLVDYIKVNPEVKEWLEKNAKGPVGLSNLDRYMSEDYNFCRKAYRAGYKIWCDMDLSFQCAHIGEQVVTLERPKNERKDA